jgi:Brp/Blh family beta-carotene 15,15'-monooxygenase
LTVAGLLIGIPHGAVDYLVPRWADLTATRSATKRLIRTYLSGAILASTALIAAPTVAVLVFLLLSALHFGTAESAFVAERRGQVTPRPWARPLASSAHGATVVGLLLWARPDEVDPWLRRLAPGAADITAALRAPGLVLLCALMLGQLAAGLVRIRAAAAEGVGTAAARRGTVRDEALPLAEQALLLTTFAVVPPLMAFGMYFGCWHAARHTGRLLDVARRPGDRDWRPATRRLVTASLAPSSVAFAVMAGLLLAGGHAPLLAVVAVVLALTFPHSALVWAFDLRRHDQLPSH